MVDLSKCTIFEYCPIRNFKPNKYECNGKGLVSHVSSYDGKLVEVTCDFYMNEAALWRTDLMKPEYKEERNKL